MEEMRSTFKLLIENVERRNFLRDLSVRGRIILKWYFEREFKRPSIMGYR
jgi:hypothetical protein